MLINKRTRHVEYVEHSHFTLFFESKSWMFCVLILAQIAVQKFICEIFDEFVDAVCWSPGVIWFGWYSDTDTQYARRRRFDSLFLTRAFGVCVLVSIYNIVRNILTINLNSTSSPRPAARRRMNHVFHKHDRHDANNARSKNKIESRHYSRTPSFVVIVIIVIIDDWPRDGHFYGDCMRNFLSFLSKTCILRG